MLEDADRVEIWLGTSTNEQLLLLGLNSWLRQEGIEPSRICLRQFYLGDGWSLAYTKIDALPETKALNEEHSNWLMSKWQALTAPTPEPLFAGSEDDKSELMQSAFRDMVSFYPDAISGLGAIEHRLLSAAYKDWTPAVRVVGDAMAAGRPLLGDMILFSRLVSLAKGSHPAIEMRGDTIKMRNSEARITDVGAACLAGAANLVEVNGLNTWVGGVHLNSEIGSVWYRPSST